MTADNGEAELLRTGAAELGVGLSTDQHETLLRYLNLLYVWNRSAGLTTIPRADAVRLHLLDSLAAVESVERGPCVDLGSGGGLPGIVLAISKPDLSFVLVESNRRKCSFLLEVARVARLPNVRVVEAGYEQVRGNERFPTVLSRAFRPPAEFLTIAADFVEPGGQVILLLADPSATELEALGREASWSVERCRRLVLPKGQEPRAVVTFRT